MSDVLHEARERALERLRRHALLLARAFDLPLRSVDAESARVRRRYGICFADGRIRIRLHQLRAPELLKYSVMVDTLCHELAHLRHLNHGERFWRLYRRILAYARRQGIYRPGPEPSAPRAAAFETLPVEITRALPREPARRPAPLGQLELF
ncbi:MAG TPA: M48 family metallopeptidase [Myxococcota bacterium]|nr:M48 family metallopeptidase [Myxococcota bacterium]